MVSFRNSVKVGESQQVSDYVLLTHFDIKSLVPWKRRKMMATAVGTAAADYGIGVKVKTHSLNVAAYNDLSGSVTGDVSIDKHNLMRVPVRLHLREGSTKNMLLNLNNLAIVTVDTAVVQKQFEMAVYHGNASSIRRCVEEFDIDVNVADENGATPVFIASCNGHVEAIQVLVELGASINTSMVGGATPLHFAVQEGHVHMATLLTTLGADINAADSIGATPVHVAAQKGYVEVVRVLLEVGGDISAPDYKGSTSLHAAACMGHVAMVQFLVQQGASVNAVMNDGSTPVLLAVQGNQIEVIRALVEVGADLNIAMKEGITPCTMAAEAGHVGVLKALVELGADFNTAMDNGTTPVLIAAQNGHSDILMALYKLGADMKPKFPFSVSEMAQDGDHADAIQLIEKILSKLTSECQLCGSTSKRLKMCSKCEKVRYCSRACQMQDYKEHKRQGCVASKPSSVESSDKAKDLEPEKRLVKHVNMKHHRL